MASEPPPNGVPDRGDSGNIVIGNVVTERDAARQATVDKEGTDPQLNRNLDQAVHLQHQLDADKETNRHKEVRYDKLIELAPVIIAAFVVFLGFGVFIGCMIAAYTDSTQAEFWAKQAERGIGTAVAALAYIFGKGTK